METKHFTPRWSEHLEADERPGALVRVVRDDAKRWQCLLAMPLRAGGRGAYSFPVRNGHPSLNAITQEVTIGLRKLGPGVWTTFPAVQGGADFHAFITLVDVPEPAPWEADVGVEGDPLPPRPALTSGP